MNTPVAKRLPWLGLIVIFLTTLLVVGFAARSFASVCLPAVAGDISCRRPYFKATGGDINTGGWYSNGYTLCDTSTTSKYQDPNFSAAGGPNNGYGGILTYAKDSGANSAGGSSEEFAAYALGLIQGNSATGTGFYTGGAQAKASGGNTNKSYLSFANTMGSGIATPADFWGGMMVAPSPDGVRQTTYCLPDYFTTKMPSTPPPGLPGGHLPPGILNQQRVYFDTATGTGDGAPLDIVKTGDVTVAAGSHVTVFVKGNVYIRNNITYDAFDADNVPKFTLVVQGSIYIGKDVTRLDGLYIAQPDPADADPLANDTGNIWTCHEDTTDLPSYTYPGSCTTKLVVNGAFIAKQVNLLRTPGDVVLPSANTSEDGFASAAGSGSAEVINLSPAMIMGGTSFFDSPSSSDIDSLISLPPVF